MRPARPIRRPKREAKREAEGELPKKQPGIARRAAVGARDTRRASRQSRSIACAAVWTGGTGRSGTLDICLCRARCARTLDRKPPPPPAARASRRTLVVTHGGRLSTIATGTLTEMLGRTLPLVVTHGGRLHHRNRHNAEFVMKDEHIARAVAERL